MSKRTDALFLYLFHDFHDFFNIFFALIFTWIFNRKIVPKIINSSTLRAPADPFARSAVSSQRSLLAAQFSRSAVSVLPSKPGRAQGWAKGPMQKAQGQRAQGTKGPFGPFGPRGPSGPWAPSGPRGAAYTQEMLSLTE